jgi:hypothetical protein
MCTTLSSDTTTNYSLYPACRYCNRLCAALPYLSILQLTICSNDYPLCSLWRYSNRPSAVLFSVWRYYNRESAQLCLPILQPTIRSALSGHTPTDYPLYSACRYYNRLSALPNISCVLYSTMSAITSTTDYPLCSETATAASFRSETERLSAQLCLAILQPTIRCASLLPL